MRIFILTIGFIFILSNAVSAEIHLSFGVYSSDKPSSMVRKFRPILNYLEISLSQKLKEEVKINLQVLATYDAGIMAITAGQVDFMRLGPASYVFAKKAEKDLKIIALESKKGQLFFKGIICTATQSLITNITDLKGKKFAFGNKKSTIGRYLSQNYMMQHQVFAKDLKSYAYLGRHDTVGMAVAAGKFDAGALKEGTFNKLISKGIHLRKIAEFDNVTKPWVAKKMIKGEYYNALQEALLTLRDPKILKSFGKGVFLRGTDGHYKVTREAILQNPKFFEKSKNLQNKGR